MTAQEARVYKKIASKLIVAEERSKLLMGLIAKKIGFKEEEDFIQHELIKLKGKNQNFGKERDGILALLMGRKLKDNIAFECKLRRDRDQARKKLGNFLGPNSTSYRKLVRKCKDEGVRVREIYKKKNMRKLEFLVKKYGRVEDGLDELKDEDQEVYWNSRVFEDKNMRPEKMRDPVIACKQDEKIELNEDGLSLLRLGPKFCWSMMGSSRSL